MNQITISFIGAGNIGGALIQAISGLNKGYLIKVYDVSEKTVFWCENRNWEQIEEWKF